MSKVIHFDTREGLDFALTEKLEAEMKALSKKQDADIDTSDIPVLDDAQWADAERGKFYRPVKKQASIRLDADVLMWLKSSGRGYQTRLNSILRDAMLKDRDQKRGVK